MWKDGLLFFDTMELYVYTLWLCKYMLFVIIEGLRVNSVTINIYYVLAYF